MFYLCVAIQSPTVPLSPATMGLKGTFPPIIKIQKDFKLLYLKIWGFDSTKKDLKRGIGADMRRITFNKITLQALVMSLAAIFFSSFIRL